MSEPLGYRRRGSRVVPPQQIGLDAGCHEPPPRVLRPLGADAARRRIGTSRLVPPLQAPAGPRTIDATALAGRPRFRMPVAPGADCACAACAPALQPDCEPRTPWLRDMLLQERHVGKKQYLFVLVTFPDAGPRLSRDELLLIARGVYLDLTEISYGKIEFPFSAHAKPQPAIAEVTLDTPHACFAALGEAGLPELRAEIWQKLRDEAAEDPLGYDRIVHVARRLWPTNGLGTVNQRDVFVDMCSTRTTERRAQIRYTIVHELGHSFQWRHSNMWEYAPNVESRNIEYTDEFDFMGDELGTCRLAPYRSPPRHSTWPRRFHFCNPWFAHRAGWIASCDIRTVTWPGRTFHIRPLEDDYPKRDGDPLALRIPVRSGLTAWIFWRRYEGVRNQGFLGDEENLSGPVVTFEYGSTYSATFLYNLNPRMHGPIGERQCGEGNEDNLTYYRSPMVPPPPGGSTIYNVYEPTDSSDPREQPGTGQELFRVHYRGHHGWRRAEVEIDFPQAPRPMPPAPVVGVLAPTLAHGEVPPGMLYRITAYVPPESGRPADGHGIAEVEMALVPTRVAEGGFFAADEPRPVFPRRDQLEALVYKKYRGLPPGGYVLRAPANAPTGVYVLLVRALGKSDADTVHWWPHIIRDPNPARVPWCPRIVYPRPRRSGVFDIGG